MEENSIKIHKWLYPASWLYGAGVALRNKLFDWGKLQSKSFNVPIICIGNIAVGGTGKTPHTEYLIKLLHDEFQVAVLSRGYKRHTKGFVLSTAESDARSIGDEPYQIQSKFSDIRVAVDEDRCHGIERLLTLKEPPVEVILLDDAFQHRYVKAGLNILLTDYHRLFCDDTLMPAGRLRESAQGKNRAQIVIVTKCGRALSQVKTNQYTSNDPNAGTEKVTYPGYTMWNLTLTQRVWKGINVNMAVNNLFNYRPDYYYANSPYTTGTNFSVGLSLDIDQMFRK